MIRQATKRKMEQKIIKFYGMKFWEMGDGIPLLSHMQEIP
jgi:hypothetical protein